MSPKSFHPSTRTDEVYTADISMATSFDCSRKTSAIFKSQNEKHLRGEVDDVAQIIVGMLVPIKVITKAVTHSSGKKL